MEQLLAYQTLVDDYLSKRKIAGVNYERIRDIIVDDLQNDSLLADLDEVLLHFRIVDSPKEAFRDASGLDYLAHQITQTQKHGDVCDSTREDSYLFEITPAQQRELDAIYDVTVSRRSQRHKKQPVYRRMRKVLSSYE